MGSRRLANRVQMQYLQQRQCYPLQWVNQHHFVIQSNTKYQCAEESSLRSSSSVFRLFRLSEPPDDTSCRGCGMFSVYGPWPEDAPQVLLNLFCCCEIVDEDGGGGGSMMLRLEDKFSERCASTMEALKSWSLGRSERSSAELMLLMSSSMGFWSMHFCESRSSSWEMAGGWACCGGGAKPAPAPPYPLPTWPASSD